MRLGDRTRRRPRSLGMRLVRGADHQPDRAGGSPGFRARCRGRQLRPHPRALSRLSGGPSPRCGQSCLTGHTNGHGVADSQLVELVFGDCSTGTTRWMNYHDVVRSVAGTTGLTRSQADTAIVDVLTVLAEVLPPDETCDLLAQLPKAIRERVPVSSEQLAMRPIEFVA